MPEVERKIQECNKGTSQNQVSKLKAILKQNWKATMNVKVIEGNILQEG